MQPTPSWLRPTPMRDLVIVGAGGHGRETLDIVEAINAVAPTWNFLGFIDEGPGVADQLERRGARIIGTGPDGLAPDTAYVIGIGSSVVRERIDAEFTAAGLDAAALIHPTATAGADNRLSPGVLLAAGARVTTNVTLGRHVHLNVNAVVSHDCTVGDYATLSPGVHLNGDVTVGDRTFFGTGAIVTPQVTVGADASVGAGAVALADVPRGVTAIGVPARW